METTQIAVVPTCIGFIMDGNRRYAKAEGLSLMEGHAKGYEALVRVVNWLSEFEVPHAVFYAFSTENWQRSQEEVQYLMTLFRQVFTNAEKTLKPTENKLRIRFIGQRKDFDQDIQAHIVEMEEKTAHNIGTTVWIALSYGGRAEIVAAVQALVARKELVTEATIAKYLWSAEMPEPDLVIRTSGEQRLSNFLPWQTVYSELFFTPTLWPAFTKDEFQRILSQYADRERRRGT